MCDLQNHNLEEIYSKNIDGCEEVVRWCSDCGAVVVDIDYDNRTYPGGVIPMKFPKIITEK